MVLASLTRRALRLGKWCPGYRPLTRRVRAHSLAILMYHGVTAEPLETFNWSQIPRAAFAEQIAFLASHYRVLPLREAIDRLQRHAPLPARAAVVTFDDGFRNVWTQAYPVLRQQGVPATVFLVTGLLGTRQPAWPEQLYHSMVSSSRGEIHHAGQTWKLTSAAERATAYRTVADQLKTVTNDQREATLARLFADLGGPHAIPAASELAALDWSEIDELARGGLIDFGSHSHMHPILSRCTPARQEAELRQSRDLLRQRLGRCDLFAYPNGTAADFTPMTQRLLADLGYRCGLATTPGLNRPDADRFALRRINIGADTDLQEFEWLMMGM